MEQLKIYLLNGLALFVSITKIEPVLQIVSLSLAIIYTLLNIYKKIK